jgi:integrase
MKVTLRQRRKGNKISLYLDYYIKGKRLYEYLQLYLTPEPEKGKLGKTQKEENRKNLELAESIRSKRHLEIINNTYGLKDASRQNSSFLRYMESLAGKRQDSKGNHDNWTSTLKHLQKFANDDVTFKQIDKGWLERFKNYLKKEAQKPLSQNTQHSYYSKVKAALAQAVREGIIQRNPALEIEGVKSDEPERNFLTYDELQLLARTPCELLILKQAFLFSSLTGLRWSDIHKMTWSEVQYSKELGYYIRFRQKKTKGAETLPISAQAYSLMGSRRGAEDQVFAGLEYNSGNNAKLYRWIRSAGIEKKITFHCARHTYATLQLTLGTDIYTVSKLLGHKNLKTTQVYAKVVDEKKKAAAEKIVLEL